SIARRRAAESGVGPCASDATALWPIPAGGRCRASALAARAAERGALVLSHRAQRCAADPARLAGSAVDEARSLVAAGGSVTRNEIAQGAPAAFDRFVQRLADRLRQSFVARQRDAPGGGRRPDAR